MRLALILIYLALRSGVAMADDITLDIQKAGYRFDQYDDKGPASYSVFVKEFREFPWAAQIGRANGGSEPTISVKNHNTRVDLWVSAIQYRDQSGFDYLVGVVYPKQRRSLLGLGPMKNVRWMEIYVAPDAATVERIYQLFFGGSLENVTSELRKLQKFSEEEARR